jgi:urease accessory protein
VIARAAVTTGPEGIRRLRSESPVVLREGADALWLVGGAAGPLGGDDLGLRLDVEAGARLTVRSAAAQVVLPSLDGSTGHWQVEAEVGPGGRLDWAPEPVVLTARARFHAHSVVRLAAGARLRWTEVVVLGRHGESPGRGRFVLRVEWGGHPVVHHELSLHPTSIGRAKVVATTVVADPAWVDAPPEVGVLDGSAALLPAAGPAAVVMALGATVAEALARCATLLEPAVQALGTSAS